MKWKVDAQTIHHGILHTLSLFLTRQVVRLQWSLHFANNLVGKTHHVYRYLFKFTLHNHPICKLEEMKYKEIVLKTYTYGTMRVSNIIQPNNVVNLYHPQACQRMVYMKISAYLDQEIQLVCKPNGLAQLQIDGVHGKMYKFISEIVIKKINQIKMKVSHYHFSTTFCNTINHSIIFVFIQMN